MEYESEGSSIHTSDRIYDRLMILVEFSRLFKSTIFILVLFLWEVICVWPKLSSIFRSTKEFFEAFPGYIFSKISCALPRIPRKMFFSTGSTSAMISCCKYQTQFYCNIKFSHYSIRMHFSSHTIHLSAKLVVMEGAFAVTYLFAIVNF